MDFDSTEGLNEEVAKVTDDLRSIGELSEDAENFNSFPKEISIPPVPASLKAAVGKCLAKDPPSDVPKLSKRGMRAFAEIDLNVKLKLPRDLAGTWSWRPLGRVVWSCNYWGLFTMAPQL